MKFFGRLFIFDKKVFPIFSISILILLFLIFAYRHFKYTPLDEAVLIESDLNTLIDKLNQIDKECSILDFKYDRNFIDFLTVKSFTTSEVGALNLAYPNNWKGPYLPDSPEIQDKVYEVVKAKDGYFIVPGRGVVLPNRLEMGKNIIIDDKTKVLEMLAIGGDLNYNGKELAKRLNFIIGDWPKEQPNTVQEGFSEAIEGLGTNLPYTQNSYREILHA